MTCAFDLVIACAIVSVCDVCVLFCGWCACVRLCWCVVCVFEVCVFVVIGLVCGVCWYDLLFVSCCMCVGVYVLFDRWVYLCFVCVELRVCCCCVWFGVCVVLCCACLVVCLFVVCGLCCLCVVFIGVLVRCCYCVLLLCVCALM